MSEPPRTEPEGKGKAWLTVAVMVESFALLTALVAPVTPSRTGSTWSPASLLWAEPSYLQEVVASFVVVNLLILGIGLVAWIVSSFGSPGS